MWKVFLRFRAGAPRTLGLVKKSGWVLTLRHNTDLNVLEELRLWSGSHLVTGNGGRKGQSQREPPIRAAFSPAGSGRTLCPPSLHSLKNYSEGGKVGKVG